MFGFLRARACPGLERADAETYQRTVEIDGRSGWLQVVPDAQGSWLTALVAAELRPVIAPLTAALRELFDLDAQPERVAACLARDPLFKAQVAARPGLRVPGAFNRFETAVRAVLGQQVSVAAATTLCARLVSRFGAQCSTPWSADSRSFPSPRIVVDAGSSELAALGMPRARAETLHGLARAVDSGELDLSIGSDPQAAYAALRRVPGVGPWTASYIAMRVLRDPDAFPAGDLHVRRALGMPTPSAAERASERWRPYRAYAVMHLWAALAQKSE